MDISKRESSPLFSIIMPAYNVENYIEKSILSVLAQDYSRFEIVVIDDSSTDGTTEIVERIASDDERVTIRKNGGRKGPAGGRNFGVSCAKGDWLCFLDSDDVLTPEALSVRKEAISCYPNCNFFSSDFVFWYPDAPEMTKKKTDTNDVWRGYFFPSGSQSSMVNLCDPLSAFLDTVLSWTGAVVLNRKFFDELGGFDESLPRGEDDHLWLRASARAEQVVLLTTVTAYYRQRMTGITQGTGSLSPYAPIMFGKLQRDPLFSDQKDILRVKKAQHIYINCLHYREHGKKLQAIKSAFHYWFFYPFKNSSVRNLIACLLLKS